MSQVELSLEQQANIQIFRSECQRLSREQAIDLLQDLYKHMVLKESCYKQLLFKDLGIMPPTLGGPNEQKLS